MQRDKSVEHLFYGAIYIWKYMRLCDIVYFMCWLLCVQYTVGFMIQIHIFSYIYGYIYPDNVTAKLTYTLIYIFHIFPYIYISNMSSMIRMIIDDFFNCSHDCLYIITLVYFDEQQQLIVSFFANIYYLFFHQMNSWFEL